MQYSLTFFCLFVTWVTSIMIANCTDDELEARYVEPKVRRFICNIILTALIAISTACVVIAILKP